VSRREVQRSYSPDGLDGRSIDFLIADAYEEVAGLPVPTSALVDGSAAERRRRRMARRAIAGVLRALPVRSVSAVQGSEVA
jgi:hypothetical protein